MESKLIAIKVVAFAEKGKNDCWVAKEENSNLVRGYFNEEEDVKKFVGIDDLLESLNELYTLTTNFLLEKECKETNRALELLVKHNQIK